MSIAPSIENVPWRLRAWAKTRWVRAVAVVLGAVLLAGTIAPYFLDADRYRGAISDWIAERTGRQVTLGKIRARFLPSVGFSVENVHLGNPAGFAPGEFVAAQEVRGALAFWPLVLRHEFLLTSLELIRPKLTLLADDRGRNNYTFSTAPRPSVALLRVAQTVSDAPAAGGAEGENSMLQVAQVSLRDAEVLVGRVDDRGHVTATMDAAGFSADLRNLLLEPLEIREWQGDIKLAGTRLTLASWSGPILIGSGGVKLRGGDLESNFVADLGKAARLAGTLNIAEVEHPVVRFDLKTQDLDLDALLAGRTPVAATYQNRPPAEEENPRGVFSPVTDDAPVVGEMIAEGHFAAEKIRAKPYVVGPLTVDVRLYPDRTEIWPFTLRLEGGSLQATARTDWLQKPQRFSVNLEARNIDVGRAVDTSPALRGKLAGTGELDLQVFGSFGQAWIASLEGKGQLALRNGRISGFNLAGAAQSAGGSGGASGDTAFTAITADLDVRHNRVSSRDVRLNSPRGTIDLRGGFGFDGVLSYDGQISAQFAAISPPGTGDPAPAPGTIGELVAKNAGKWNVPISLRGTLLHPQIGPGSGLLNFPAPVPPKQEKGPAFPNLFQK